MRDLYVFRLSQAYGGNTFIRYSSVLFGLTLLYIVITRFRVATAQARDLNANLAARVARREQELEQSYQRVEQLAREQERNGERTRILRDMHDGVGSHISTAIRQLESGRASPGEVLQTLRDSLDQLKLSIDAINLPPGDITALLANLRYRLEPRFKVSDIELQWDVDLLPPMARLDDKAMRHLQFMVFEALSNVLQHAHASKLRIELRPSPRGGAQLRVIDNGCGFEPERVKRRGLSSLRERAAVIGAALTIASAPGNTVVEIVLL
jgi:signal transduction histidine kinase